MPSFKIFRTSKGFAMAAQIVSFHCVLRNRVGRVISRTFNEDVITQSNRQGDDVLRGLVEGLSDLRAGEFRRITAKEGSMKWNNDYAKKVLENIVAAG
jgi:hypothetical protein